MFELSLNDFENIISNNKCAFLCGNGFSINFDDDYRYIYDNLLEAHKKVICNGQLKIRAIKNIADVFQDNFNSIKSEMRNYDQSDFDTIFTDGIYFAKSILENKELIDMLKKNRFISNLVFGTSQLNLVENIVNIGREKGYKSVNIEYWTILIYFYYAIKKINSDVYHFPSNNKFIYLLEVGSKNSNPIINSEDIQQFVMTNGFNLYYRFLFSTSILCNGKSVNCNKLSKLNNINPEKLIPFLNLFELLMTLNYDHILEYLTKRNVTHIHGEYVIGKEEYVWICSLGIKEQGQYISFSDILVGDYFIKVFSSAVNSLANGKGIKQTIRFADSIDKNLRKNDITHIVIFGMNINNDQHIIRNIMLSLYDRINQNVGIIYCYFEESDKETFQNVYQKVITFSKDISENVRQIPVYFIKSQYILDKYFY
ncbi:hypothetical protein [Acetivibrio clariflavus]|uniref:hypothetical protein n=1 Tax=Acetivibrio clariflavus TaxID=288965 RepID=UPI000482020C|nr:hypothetical protein [Acetivibrio clariflavus]